MAISEDRQKPDVFVVLAVYKPDVAYLEQQIASLACQTLVPFLVAVDADTSSFPLIKQICERHDLKFHVVCSDRHLDVVSAFETGLAKAIELAGDGNALFAFCDQDDVWDPRKLDKSADFLLQTGAALVHCDARVVDQNGKELEASMFRSECRAPRPNLRQLLYRSTVTGMTCLFTMKLAQLSLPFPRTDGTFCLHDRWLGLLAETLPGGLRFLDERLVDYRQHQGNVLGISSVNSQIRVLPKMFSNKWRGRGYIRYMQCNYLIRLLETRLRMSKEVADNDAEIRCIVPFHFELISSFMIVTDCVAFLKAKDRRTANVACACLLVPWRRLALGFVSALKGRGYRSAVEAHDIGLYRQVLRREDALWHELDGLQDSRRPPV